MLRAFPRVRILRSERQNKRGAYRAPISSDCEKERPDDFVIGQPDVRGHFRTRSSSRQESQAAAGRPSRSAPFGRRSLPRTGPASLFGVNGADCGFRERKASPVHNRRRPPKAVLRHYASRPADRADVIHNRFRISMPSCSALWFRGAQIQPLDIAVVPPTTSAFSMTRTLAPFASAASAALNPAAPVPTTTTSNCST